jgi:hypothetical protein
VKSQTIIKKALFTLFLVIANLATGQINGGFEIWDTTYTNVYSSELENKFSVPNPLGGIINKWTSGYGAGISRTTDSHSGNYSLILHNWYLYDNETVNYKDTLNYRPGFLQGYFKYITTTTDGISQGIMRITLTRFNGITSDTIGSGILTFDSTFYFKPFQININYTSAMQPDSMNIYIINSERSCISNIVCNLLYIDDLSLTNTPLGTENPNFNNRISFYPNPANDRISFILPEQKSYTFKMYDTCGKLIKTTQLKNGTMVPLKEIASGIYFCIVVDNNARTVFRDKVIVK